MPSKKNLKTVVLPEFDAAELGIPFQVKLLDSVEQVLNPATGKVEKTTIPNIPGLIRCAAMARILVPRKLSGPELKFIRKAFRTPAKKLAETIGVSPEHLSRCEAGDRVLSAGAEKCLRISVFLENFKLPEDIDSTDLTDAKEKSEKIRRFIEIYKKAIIKIENILTDMRIDAAHCVNDELILAFTVVRRSPEDLFKDDLDADWSSNDSEYSLAA